MARIPGVRYLQSPVSMPRMDGAGQAIGRATEQLGSAIGEQADTLFKYAGRLRKQKDAAGMSAFLTEMDSKAAEFEAGLIRNQNPDGWNQEWDSNITDWRNSIDSVSVSPEAKAQLKIQFNAWAGAKSDRLMTTAALKSVETSKGIFLNNLDLYNKKGDRIGSERTRTEMRGSGIFREDEIQKADIISDHSLFQTQLGESIISNPDQAEEFVKSSSFMDQPGATQELKEGALGMIKTVKRERMNLSIDEFNDGMAQGNFRTLEDIDNRFSGRVPPRILGKMKDDFKTSQTESFKMLQASPEYQNRVRGAALVMIEDFNAEVADYDEKAVEINRLIRTLPEGDATRLELQNYFNDKRSGQLEDYTSTSQLMRKQLVEAYKGGVFTPPVQEQSVASRVDAGLLRNKESLLEAGFSEDQAEKIVEAKSDADQIKQFRSLYPIREKKSIAKDPFRQASFEAIQRGDSTIRYSDPEVEFEAKKNLGDSVKKLDLWLKENPDKATDGEALAKKMGEIVAPFGVKNFQAIVLPPVPSFMNEDAPLLQPLDAPPVDPFLPR